MNVSTLTERNEKKNIDSVQEMIVKIISTIILYLTLKLTFLQNPDRSRWLKKELSFFMKGVKSDDRWPVVTGGYVSLSVWRGDEAPL